MTSENKAAGTSLSIDDQAVSWRDGVLSYAVIRVADGKHKLTIRKNGEERFSGEYSNRFEAVIAAQKTII